MKRNIGETSYGRRIPYGLAAALLAAVIGAGGAHALQGDGQARETAFGADLRAAAETTFNGDIPDVSGFSLGESTLGVRGDPFDPFKAAANQASTSPWYGPGGPKYRAAATCVSAVLSNTLESDTLASGARLWEEAEVAASDGRVSESHEVLSELNGLCDAAIREAGANGQRVLFIQGPARPELPSSSTPERTPSPNQ